MPAKTLRPTIRTPPRVPLSHDRIVAEAIALADAEGLAALSMRKLAQRLGVEAMSLYNHMANKEELLFAMVEAVASNFYKPQVSDDWRAQMRARAQAAYGQLCSHPWLGGLLVSLPHTGANMLGYVEATLNALVGAGFYLTEADAIWNSLDSHIYGFALQKLNFPFEPEDYARAAAENLDLIPIAVFPNLRGLAELVAARRYDGMHQLSHGLDLLLDGLERRRIGQPL